MRSKISIITAFVFCSGILCPMSIWGQETSAINYQELIQKNFALREDFKVLEERYIGLENERKVLILRVKELQVAKNSRLEIIRNLKNMIASLKGEMLKDPKLTKIIDVLNRRIKKAESQRDLFQEEVSQFEAEKNELDQKMKNMELLVDKQKEPDDKVNTELAEAKKEVDRTQQRIGQLESEKKELEQKMSRMEAVVSAETEQDQAISKELVKIGKERDLSLEKIEQLKAEKNELDQKLKNMELLVDKQKEPDDKVNTELAEAKKEVDRTQQRIGQLESEKKELEQKMSRIEAVVSAEKEQNQAISKELVEIKKERDLKMAQVSLGTTEKALRDELSKVQGLEKRGESRLRKDIKRLDREKNKLGKKMKRLEKNFQKADRKNQKLDQKIVELTEQVREGDKINRRLIKDLKGEQTVLANINKSLKKEQMKSAFEQEHYEEQLKFAKADRAMFDAKIQDLEQRTLVAETRRSKIEEELQREASKALLKESKVIVLQEERSKLQKKLLKYIEQTMDLQDEARGDPIQKKFVKSRGLKTKKQIAHQKLKMHYNMAVAYDQLKMYKEEEKEYKLCLKINAKDANVHYNLAILYDDKLNRNDKAIVHYRKYLNLHPTGEGVAQVKEWLLHAEQQQRLGTQSR